jgi:glycosyltransferase involved in cell wall biosynthesis
MKPKVSIIVPVYNAGKYLNRCLDSLINQTLKDIEIILVLDVPTDGSDKVAEIYARQDSRIKLIYNKSNLHIGFSRNEGLKIATGEYVGFADHDDYCDIVMFENLYNEAKFKNADVVVSNFYEICDNEKFYFAFPTGLSDTEFQKKYFTALINGKYSKRNTYSFDNVNSIWTQLYKNDFLKTNNICFTDNKVITMEDVLFNIKVHYFAKKVCYLPEMYYYHITNDQNTFDNYEYRAISKVIPHLEVVYTFLTKNKLWQDYQGEFAECTLKRLYTSYRNELKFKNIFYSFDFIRQIRKNKDIQNVLSVIKNNKNLIKKFSITKTIFLYSISK